MSASPSSRLLSRFIYRVSAPLLGVTIAAGSCSFPTDVSTGTFVAISAPSQVLIRGQETKLVARVWRRGGAGDSTEIRNVDLAWFSADTRLATVSAEAGGVGRVTGVNPGVVELRAVAGGL
ncbi:MAG TPA: Ig-like domain-containing protein, partial [Gemmatimonadaceae bacterium]|nr:Ig-like domain-containing protein [Gemmatimonadaceae bacterium]